MKYRYLVSQDIKMYLYLLIELIMRNSNYETFKKLAVLDKECNRKAKKLVSQLLKLNNYDNDVYEIKEYKWNGKKHGLCYYIYDNILKIFDYKDGELIAFYYYSIMREFVEVDERKYKAKMDIEKYRIDLPKIPNYSRTHFPLDTIKNSTFFL